MNNEWYYIQTWARNKKLQEQKQKLKEGETDGPKTTRNICKER